jgi:hypothetical protein
VAKTSLYSLFKKTEPYEQRLGKDCSQFTKEEIINMYTEFKAKSVYVLMNYNTMLKAYCAWMKYYHELNNDVAYDVLTIDTMRPLIPNNVNKILSRQDISEIEDNLYNWVDKAIVEALWEGLSGHSMRDLVGIDSSMIDHDSRQLHLPDGRVFGLTERLYEFLTKAFEETEYMCYGETLRVKPMIGRGKLYKERDNAHAADSDDRNFRWVYRKVQNFRDHVGIPGLTMKNIHISGMYHYLCQGMQDTGLDLKSFLRSEDGRNLAAKYGFHSESYVDNLAHRFKDFV